MMKYVSQLQGTELHTLLGNLRKFGDMRKKLGKRGSELFQRELSGVSCFGVEFFPALSQDEAYEQSQVVFKKCFGVSPSRDEIVFHSNPQLQGGIRVIRDDEMVDISYSKVEKLLKK